MAVDVGARLRGRALFVAYGKGTRWLDLGRVRLFSPMARRPKGQGGDGRFGADRSTGESGATAHDGPIETFGDSGAPSAWSHSRLGEPGLLQGRRSSFGSTIMAAALRSTLIICAVILAIGA